MKLFYEYVDSWIRFTNQTFAPLCHQIPWVFLEMLLSLSVRAPSICVGQSWSLAVNKSAPGFIETHSSAAAWGGSEEVCVKDGKLWKHLNSLGNYLLLVRGKVQLVWASQRSGGVWRLLWKELESPQSLLASPWSRQDPLVALLLVWWRNYSHF